MYPEYVTLPRKDIHGLTLGKPTAGSMKIVMCDANDRNLEQKLLQAMMP